MRRQSGRDRQARLLQFYETLPPIQRGVVICVLLGNAVLVVTIEGVVVVAVVRGAIHSWRHRRLGPVVAMRSMGPPLCAALAAISIQWVVAHGLMRAVDTGRASAWLERSERWLDGKRHADPEDGAHG